jgi:hypothetical protein
MPSLTIPVYATILHESPLRLRVKGSAILKGDTKTFHLHCQPFDEATIDLAGVHCGPP